MNASNFVERDICFRIWDNKHHRWFQGGTSPDNAKYQTQGIHLFGEVNLLGSILHDQNEDDVWKNDKDIQGSLSVIRYLTLVESIGVRDKDGTLIFNGDIVELKVGENVYEATITWDNEHLCYRMYSDNDNEYVIDCNNCKVIGNVFEGKFDEKY